VRFPVHSLVSYFYYKVLAGLSHIFFDGDTERSMRNQQVSPLQKNRTLYPKSLIRAVRLLGVLVLVFSPVFMSAPRPMAINSPDQPPAADNQVGSDQIGSDQNLAGQRANKASLVSVIDVASLPSGGATPHFGSIFSLIQETGNGPLFATVAGRDPTSSGAILKGSHPQAMAGSGGSNITVSTKFDALNEIGNCACHPPDVQVAAGPSSLVEMVNLGGAVYTKQGTLVKSFLLNDFFTTGLDFISDPKVLYDAPSGRWFASIVDLSNGFISSNLTIATSTTSDPTGTWRIYKIVGVPYIADQPLIGVNDDKFVISTNDYSIQGFSATFNGAEYWVLNKVELLAGQPMVDFASFGPDQYLITAHPAQSLSSTTTEWMVSNTPITPGNGKDTFLNNTVYVISLAGVPPNIVTPTRTSITVSVGTQFANESILGGSQPGTNRTINTNDIRIQDVSWFQDKLWFSQNDACRPTGDNQFRACFHLGQVDTGSLTLRQQFDAGARGQSFFYPALRQDALGNLIVIYGFSSSSHAGGTDIYPSLAAVGQAVTDPINSLGMSQTIVTGNANDTSGRYGDYFGAGLDPSNPSIVWVAGEYHNLARGPRCFGYCYNNWSTYIANVRMTRTNSTSSPVSLSDIGIWSSTPTLSLGPGQQSAATITVSSVNFGGTLTLSPSSAGSSAMMNPTSVTLASGGTATSTLTLSNPTSTVGFYTAAVSTSAPSRTVSLILLVAPISFNIRNIQTFTGVNLNASGTVSVDSPSSAFTVSGTVSTLVKNSTTGTTIYSNTFPVTRLPFLLNSSGYYQTQFLLNSWLGPYSLSSNIAISYPSNSHGLLNSTAISVNRNVDINLDGVVNSLDSSILQASLGCVIGNQCYNGKADLNADGVIDFNDLNILNNFLGAVDLIPSFTFTALQVLTFPAASGGTSTLTIKSVNGFAGTVNLSPSVSPAIANAPTASLSPTSVSLTSGGSGTSRLTVSSTTSTTGGIYVVNVTATNAPQTRSFGFAIVITPLAINGGSTAIFYGVNVTVTGSLAPVTGVSSTLSVSGPISIVATNKTTGSLLWSYTYSLTRLTIPLSGVIAQGTSNPAFNFFRVLFFDIPVTTYPLAYHVFFAWSGPKSTSLVSPSLIFHEIIRNPDINLNGMFDVSDAHVLNNDQGCYIGTPCYDPKGDLTAVGFTGYGSILPNFISTNIGATDFLPFNISANPSTLTVLTGSTANSTITLTSQGFFGTVTLSSTSNGPSCTLSATSLNLNAGGTNMTVITVTASVAAGNYTVTVTGTNGSQSMSTNITVRASDFSVSSSRTTIIFPRASNGITTITLTSLNRFSGTVTLSGIATPSDPTAAFNPPSITLTPNGSGTSTMTLSNSTARTGLYKFVLTATSGAISHSITFIVAITPVQFAISDREVFIGVNVTTTGTLSLDSPGSTMTISGRMTTVATNNTTHQLISSKNYTLAGFPLWTDGSGGYRLKLILNITATATPLGSDITLTLPAPTSSSPGTSSWSMFVSRNPDVLQRGTVDLVDYSYISARYGCKVGDSCYDPRADVANHGIIDIIDIGIVNAFYGAKNFNS
jgi:hypothetical protein